MLRTAGRVVGDAVADAGVASGVGVGGGDDAEFRARERVLLGIEQELPALKLRRMVVLIQNHNPRLKSVNTEVGKLEV